MQNEAEAASNVATWLRDAGAYLWVFLLSFFGGAVSFWQKVRSGEMSRWAITELVGELFTSGFSGLLTYFLCRWGNVDPWLSAAFVGVGGHMGSRLIFMVEKMLTKKFGP